ncbi:MAG: hypothetical protein MI974_22500 [Chitinophagales bacterium]|nr:hypothetical protein [Chitinophagales bacterium]
MPDFETYDQNSIPQYLIDPNFDPGSSLEKIEEDEFGFTFLNIKEALQNCLGYPSEDESSVDDNTTSDDNTTCDDQKWLIGMFINIKKGNDGESISPQDISVEIVYLEGPPLGDSQPITNYTLNFTDSEADILNIFNATFTPIAKKIRHTFYNLNYEEPFNIIGKNDTQGVPITYFSPINKFELKDSNYQKVSKLRFHRDWAEKVFFTRTDLETLYFYLADDTKDYDDIFFSGSVINYGYMTNHRSELKSRISKYERNTTTSRYFTLKAEPFVTTNPDYSDQDSVYSAGNDFSGNNGTSEVHMPAALLGLPCPDWWEATSRMRSSAAGLFSPERRKDALNAIQISNTLFKKIIIGDPNKGMSE